MRLSLLALALLSGPAFAAEPPKLKVLFLGDSAGHQPATRFKIIQPVFAARNIDLTYTDKLDDLNAKTLAGYDGLAIYANHTRIAPEQEKALLDFVAAGKGFVFYTAWGHDQRTWSHPGFQNLLERGIRWACGQDPALAGDYFEKPKMTEPRKDVKPFEYVPAKVPFYPPRGPGKADPITR